MERKPKIRKALFIGLGGTGAMSLIELKKKFKEVYGHVDADKASLPEFVKFMVFDTDVQGTLQKSRRQAVNAVSGKVLDVEFDPAEVIPMAAEDAGEYVMSPQNKDQFGWVPLENTKVLDALKDLDKGAGQIRLFGRVAHFFNYADIRKALADGINQIQLARHGNAHFEPLGNDDDLEIHIVTSLAGGTGSGMFMDVGMLVREILDSQGDKADIHGYFVMPSVFSYLASTEDMKRTKPNAMGALKELDFFMEFETPDRARAQIDRGNEGRMTKQWIPEHSGLHETGEANADFVTLSFMGGQGTRLTGPPYSHVYLIDAKNNKKGTFDQVEDLAATVAKGLFTAVSSMSGGLVSKDDNDNDGLPRFNNKLGWVGSVGISELVYNLPDVRLHLALRIIEKGLLDLLQPCESMAGAAQAMLEEEGLTEVGDRSDLVNSILKASTLVQMELYEDQDAKVQRTKALSTVHKCYSELEAKAKAIQADALRGLESMDRVLPESGRIHARIALMEEIEELLVSFKEEVTSDKAILEGRKGDLEKDLFNGPDSTESRLAELEGAGMIKRMLKKREIEDERDAWEVEMYDLMQLELKQEAMLQAVDVLSNLGVEVGKRLESLRLEKGNLETLLKSTSSRLAKREHEGCAKPKVGSFLKQLHGADMRKPIDLSGMSNWNPGGFLDGMTTVVGQAASADWIEQAVAFIESQNYAVLAEYSGPDAEEMTRSLLMQKLQDAKGQNPKDTEVGQLFSDLLTMSSPMIAYRPRAFRSDDDRTLTDIVDSSSTFVVCVPADNDNDALVQRLRDLFQQLIPPGKGKVEIQPVPDQKDRVTVYQRMKGIPVCALTGFDTEYSSYKRRHDRTSGEVFHVNYNWVDVMDQVKHDLKEGASVAGERALENWTKALLLGYITWNPDRDEWHIKGGNSEIEENIKGKDRSQLFEHLMSEMNYGEDMEANLRHLIRNVDPKAIRKRLDEVLVEDQLTGKPVFRDKPEDSVKNGKMYFGNETINPYVDGRTESDMYGSATYNRLGKKESLELLKMEEECLKALWKSEA